MPKATENLISFPQESSRSCLDEILRDGAREMLGKAIEDEVAAHERSLVDRFLRGAAEIPGVTAHGPEDLDLRCGVMSFTIDGMVTSEVGTLLDREYGIMSRVGLHCAPGAHQTIGTFPTGSVRFGLSWFTTADEIDEALGAVDDMAQWAAAQ